MFNSYPTLEQVDLNSYEKLANHSLRSSRNMYLCGPLVRHNGSNKSQGA